VIALIAGLICIRRPGESLLALVLAVGIYLVASGVVRMIFAAVARRWWGVAVGALDGIIGIVILSWPKLGLVTLAVLFALSMLVRGAFAIFAGIRLRSLRDVPDEAPPATAVV
jgi:uncharacterized membrane protein HdeD (DUF308 family)